MRYIKSYWNEDRGDEYAHWGNSVWYIELNEEGYPLRQIEIYDNGVALTYDNKHLEDQYGGLGDQAVTDEDIYSDYPHTSATEIAAPEFEEVWTTVKPINR